MKGAIVGPAMNEKTVRLTQGDCFLEGILCLPAQALGIVVFAHGSGSGRFSPRNNFVARHLQQGRVPTLLIDLLTPDEADDRRKVFDIDLLANRVLRAKAWLEQNVRTKGLGIGYVAPVPAPARPYRQQPVTPHRFGLSCHGAAGLIWLNPISPLSPRRLC